MKKIFSVIIPVYNVEEYLSKCLDSVFNQTLKNIEVICIEDCSTDNSLNILRQYEKQHDNLIIFRHEKNEGLEKSLNDGLNLAGGEFVYILDSDDYIEENTLEYTYNVAKKDGADMVVFGAAYFPIEAAGEKAHYFARKFKTRNIKYTDPFLALFDEEPSIPHWWNKIFKNSIIQKNNFRFFEKIGNMYLDNSFMLISFPKFKRITYVEERFCHHRVRANSDSAKRKTMAAEEITCIKIEAIKKINDSWQKDNYLKKHGHLLANYFLNNIYIEFFESNIDYQLSNINIIYDKVLTLVDENKLNGAAKEKYKEYMMLYMYRDYKNEYLKMKEYVEGLTLKCKLLDQEVKEIRKSNSYRAGRIVTYLPRKIKTLLSNL